MKAIFVAGTDTGVGKSMITGLLGRYLLENGYRVVTQKWIQTGSAGNLRDIDTHLKLMAKRRSDFCGYLPSMAPYFFKLASSPHLAAGAEKKRIKISKIRRCLKNLSGGFDRVIIEGSGGLLVPLDKKLFLVDAIKKMRLPVLLVTANRLGAINSTLLSIEALKSRGIKTAGVVFNNILKNENGLILEDNPVTVKAFSGVEVFGTLPYAKNRELLHKAFVPIGNRMEGRLWKTG